jgi:hypothetical protein
MKYKHIKTTILAGSAQVDVEQGTSTFQANIKFEILPEIQGHEMPDQYKTPELTFFGLVFETLDMQTVLSEADAKGIEKLKEIYGNQNVTI